MIGMFAVSFFIVLLITPFFIRKMHEMGYTVLDQYKQNKPKIADMGGLVILFGIIGSLLFTQILLASYQTLTLLYAILSFFFLFGFIDDLMNFNRAVKILLPFLLALPISSVINDTNIWLGFFIINLGVFYTYLIAPTYVMVVSNLVNMHSGYNGLATGLSSILFFFAALKSYLLYGPESILLILPIFGAVLAFWYYDKYPSKIFLGNSGSLIIGAALGAFLVLNKLELFGVVALLPHIVNFLMYVVWKIKKVGEVKFGKTRKDGSLIVPNNLTFKWFFPYYFRLTEAQATGLMYLITTIFCTIALIL